MKVYGVPRGPAARGTKIAGAIVLYRMKDGRVIARAWPRKRGKYQSERQRQWGEWFALASKWATAPDPGSQEYALATTDSTIFFPRDLLIKMVRGSLWNVTMADGTQIWNIWDMAEQIQVELDTITQVPGSILYRGPTEWVALEPGQAGFVFTSTGTQGLPQWQAAAGGGIPGIWQILASSSGTSSGNATKGMSVTIQMDLNIGGVAAIASFVEGATYKVAVGAIEGGVFAAPFFTSALQTATADGIYPMLFQWAEAVEFASGSNVAVMLIRTDGSDTTNCALRTSNQSWPNVFTAGDYHSFALASKEPKIGDAVSVSGGGLACSIFMV